MAIVRNLFVLGLIVCVGYSGYIIYLTHYSGAAHGPDESVLDEAPLYSPDAFVSLGTEQPTSTSPAPALAATPNIDWSNPAETLVAEGPPAPSLAKLPQDERPTKEPTTAVAMMPADDEYGALSSADLWRKADAAAQDGKPYRAYRLYSLLMDREDVAGAEREQLLATLQPLADKVVYAPHKHLALPAVTVKPGMTLEEVAAEHQIPVVFLRVINGIEPGAQPEPGDALKVVEGPLTLRLNATRKEITLWTAAGFAGIVACGELPANLENGTWNAERIDNDGRPALKLADVTLSGNAESGDWQSLLNLLDQQTTMLVSGVSPPEVEPLVPANPAADAQVVVAETPVEEATLPAAENSPESMAPIDSLRVEVFAPSKPVAVGAGANFGLRITNLSDKPAPDVTANVFFSEGMEPLKLIGAEGKLAVGQAAFRPMTLAPRGHVDLEIQATVTQQGRQIYCVTVGCEAWDTQLRSEMAVATLGKAPEPPVVELTEKPEPAAPENPSKR